MTLFTQVSRAFIERYGSDPSSIVRAPGRVNLIGEHTDYNDGFVLPMAIDKSVCIASRKREDDQVSAFSMDFGAETSFPLTALQAEGPTWVGYLKGIAWALMEQGHALQGWDGIISGDIPIGAGLSSSAALELAAARTFVTVSNLPWEPSAMALLAQKAENVWLGMQCGIMDQLVSASGQTRKALLIDCRSLEITPVPLPQRTMVVVMDTATRRTLIDSAYNDRRAQCASAAAVFGVPALRDLDVPTFEAGASRLDPLPMRRARHVVYENARTLHAAEVLRQGDAHTFGALMNESHASLRDDFEVSSDALNEIVTAAQAQPGCFGARMTGAGFGGCAVALVAEDALTQFMGQVPLLYEAATGLIPQLYPCQAVNGVERIGTHP